MGSQGSMVEIPYLAEIVALFAGASTVIVISRRLHIPPVIGFLLTGMVMGPMGLGVVRDRHDVEVFAELGVVFLLFVVGLHVSLDRLKALARPLLLGGGTQAVLTVVVVLLTCMAFGVTPRLALFYGFVVLMSSTAIVLKLYAEANELDAPHGQLGTAILLFQDFLIVPLLLVVPVLAGTTDGTRGDALGRFFFGLLLVGVCFAVGRLIVGRLLEAVARSGVREVFVLAGLLSCLGGALLTQTLGLSLALGAFLAGILIADTDFHHQVVAETGPFRDAFNALFFMSIGMLLDLSVVVSSLLLVLGLALAVIALKAVTAYGAVVLLGYPHRVRAMAALGLAQIGEFSFVLVQRGGEVGLVPPDQYQVVVAVIVLTMMVAPILIRGAPALTRSRGAPGGSDGAIQPAEEDTLSDHIIIGGYGLNGRHLARVLSSTGCRYVVVDLDPRAVRRARSEGHQALFGDLTRPDIQSSAGVPRARVLVLGLSDPTAMEEAIRVGRDLAPDAFILARARQLTELAALRALGADAVVAEEFEASIEIVTHVLRKLHIPGNVIRAEARLLRAGEYEMLREPVPKTGVSEEIAQALAAGTTDTFRVLPGHYAVAQTLRTLELR
ncbi:MAG: cation:proton antiporter, partial [Gemmatimonadota bacterium]|nr:cation:proton antiporter [Gemmatimonadota bacterium]